MTKVRSSTTLSAMFSLVSTTRPSRRWPASSLNFSSFDSAGVAGEVAGCRLSVACSTAGCSATGNCEPATSFFAFLRIFTRSTMDLHSMLARRGRDARRVDRRSVFAEGIEQRRRGEGVDQARDAAADDVDLRHRFARERIALAAGDADAVVDVVDRFLE